MRPILRRSKFVVAAFGACALAPIAAMAEEGGSGHYMPGSMASFMDSVSPTETFLVRLNVVYYGGSAEKDQPLPIAGVTALGLDASSWAYGLTLFWRPAVEIGDRWSYAMSATIPYVDMDVSASAFAAPGGIGRAGNETALGDIVLMPLMLNYHVNPDLNVNFRVGFYAPTGSYEVGRLANTGKNFWTVEPVVGLMYFGQKNGIEASLFAGIDFNSENEDTSYKSGSQAHLDGTLAQHFPFAGGLAGAGLSAYYYEQVTGDGGSGATFGDFKGRTVGIGPVLSFINKIGGHDSLVELKWLHEVETRNRLEGDIAWLKWIYKFY
jgi:hypothetical protein